MVGVMRHGASSSTLRSVRLGRGQMRMDVHVWLGLIHAVERGRAGVIALLGDAILRIQALSAQIWWWQGTPGFLDRRGTRQARSSARAGQLLRLL